MSYGELTLPPVWTGINKQNGRFLKGHEPHNKGKKWSEWMSKRGQRKVRKGWQNVLDHRPKTRPDTAGRCRKQVIAVMDDGRWFHFAYLGDAAKWVGGNRENVGRCCRCNQSRKRLKKPWGHPSDKVNTDHKYMGIRFYFESDNVWTTKINNP